MGPAVINGGITTFLAVILLCDSKSHAFITFFKVFFLTVVLGLFHAIVFLPILLGIEVPSFSTTEEYKDEKQCVEKSCEQNHKSISEVCRHTKDGAEKTEGNVK